MKKNLILLFTILTAAAIISLSGCGSAGQNTTKTSQENTQAATQISTQAAETKSQTAAQPSNQSANLITESDAKSAALKDAGLNESNVQFIKCQLETDDGVSYYDIEFTTTDQKFDYEILADSVIIKEKEVEAISSNNQSTEITEAEAKNTALIDAGVSESDATFTKINLETDDGVQVFEIEFVSGGMNYEYTINASTGEIIEKSIESVND